MPAPKYPRGSEWRKWDLHFHTPASFDYQFKAATNAQIVQTMIDAKVGAFAVTDHHVMEVPRIKDMQTIAAGRITIFPGIELRTELGGSSLVHMIGIFPEDCDLADTWTKVSAKLGITPADVQRKGDDRVYVDFRDSAKLIRELGGIVTVHAGLKANTIEGIKNSELYKQQLKTDLLNESVDVLEVGRASDLSDYEKIVFPRIGIRLPVCVFSDNHDIRSYPVSEPCWIKADPTFQGLRQIIHEPEDRVFLGDVPPSVARATRRATRVARSVEVRKTEGATTSEKWFDCSIPLNVELVVVIGKKGSGKSALSDILGLLGNTLRHQSFSFLTSEKFRRPKNNKSRQFQAALTWADGTVDSVPSLDVNPSSDAVEKVKYIPQSYLEDICNEIGAGKGGRFYNELQQVIFSHVPEVERLGFGSLDELLAHRSEETNQAIAQLVGKLEECNALIVAAEERLLPQHRKALESQLAEKKRELDAHVATHPQEVAKPDADPTAQQQSKEAAEELEKKQGELKALEAEIAILRVNDLAAAKKYSTAEKLVGKLKNLERHFEAFLAEARADFEELNLTASDLVSLKVNVAPINAVITALGSERVGIAAKLSAETEGGPESRRRAVGAAIEGLQAKLSAPQRAYQAYLQVLKEWEAAKAKIIGAEDVIGSIKSLEKQLSDLDNLPAYLKGLMKQRQRKLLEIFGEKQKLRKYYKSYYGSVQTFLKDHPLAANEQFQLTFNVSMAESGFAESFLGRLNRRKVGPFMGDEEGAAEMKRLLDSATFDSPLGSLRFTKALLNKMTERDGRQLLVKDQLRQGVSVQEIYNFVFSLGFLSPIYNLQWDGKGLEQLSPGERGNLLLIFYLLVDRDDIPLVIDQPEENLDNQTVYKTLVPCIKDAKKRRQIVMVTHNPNLAVVCDAEQIICADMQKDHENAVTYTSGSIEEPIINRRIVDILEGTRPAFDKRDDKYLP